MRTFRIYRKYLAMAIKAKLAYKADLMLNIFSFCVTNIVAFFTLKLTVGNIILGEWTFEMIMFMYGLLLIPKGIDHVFSDKLWWLGGAYIASGQIDKNLTKPYSVLLQLMGERFMFDGFAEIILGSVFIGIYGGSIGVAWTFGKVIMLIFCEFLAIWIFYSIKLFYGSLAFWFKRTFPIQSVMYNMNEFTYYPLNVMGKVMLFIMTIVAPFGLAVFLPAQHIIFGTNSFTGDNLLLLMIIITLGVGLVLGTALFTWHRGLKRYDSSGY